MATRSLMEIFLLLRNNALQNTRFMYADHDEDDDRVSLINKSVSSYSNRQSGGPASVSLAPMWVDKVEEVQYEVTKIKGKIKELADIRDKHFNRPSFDDNEVENVHVQALTSEITGMFQRCQKTMKTIAAHPTRSTGQEKTVASNVIQMLMRELQDLSQQFCRSQSKYVKQMKHRDERTLFSTDEMEMGSAADFQDIDLSNQQGSSTAQMLLLEQNTEMVKHREKQIQDIVSSIHDLNQTFKDIAGLVVDQGTVLDRIDYNIENTSFQIEAGHTQLVKAEKHQKKNRKMLVILILTGLIVILMIVLVAIKTK